MTSILNGFIDEEKDEINFSKNILNLNQSSIINWAHEYYLSFIDDWIIAT